MFIAMNCRYQANELVIISMKDHFYIQGDFFNWASPEFAKCWPEVTDLKKILKSQTAPP